jgi:hypothetical protein
MIPRKDGFKHPDDRVPVPLCRTPRCCGRYSVGENQNERGGSYEGVELHGVEADTEAWVMRATSEGATQIEKNGLAIKVEIHALEGGFRRRRNTGPNSALEMPEP